MFGPKHCLSQKPIPAIPAFVSQIINFVTRISRRPVVGESSFASVVDAGDRQREGLDCQWNDKLMFNCSEERKSQPLATQVVMIIDDRDEAASKLAAFANVSRS